MINMEPCGDTITKRRRVEDYDGDQWYSHTSGHADGLTSDTPRQHKRHRSSIGKLDAYMVEKEDTDEVMMDIYEPLSPPLSEPETLPLPIARPSDGSGSISVSKPAGPLSLEDSCIGTESPSSILEYPAMVSRILDPGQQENALPGTAYRNVKLAIEGIAHQVGPQRAFETKKNGLLALGAIASTILHSGPSRPALEVRAQFERDGCIPLLMLQVIQSMTMEDLRSLSEESIYGGNFYLQLRSSHERAVEDYVAGFYDFSLVLEAISQGICQR
ncbi:hypothetical protein BJ166DRAFT_540433 [Pestalotiopsis sp. NC0098]|nr:hypothetical protein BJ166DRAFT_540433 [Pestalotiopsis sp. NC0098]